MNQRPTHRQMSNGEWEKLPNFNPLAVAFFWALLMTALAVMLCS